MHVKMLSTAVACALLASTTPLLAATTTGTLDVKLTVLDGCYIETGGGVGNASLDFGTQVDFGGNIDADTVSGGHIELKCTSGTAYSIGLDEGANANASQRRMAQGTDYVTYDLYQDSGRTTRWGNVAGTDTVDGTSNGLPMSFTVYGRVPTQAMPADGTYTDTVTIAVTY